MADQMTRDNAYPDEVTPLLHALIKSRNGKLHEAQKLLDEGSNISLPTDSKVKRNHLSFPQEKWLSLSTAGVST